MDTLIWFVALLLSLAAGVLWILGRLRWKRRRAGEDILKAVLNARLEGRQLTTAWLGTHLGLMAPLVNQALADLIERGLLTGEAPHIELSPEGLRTAKKLLKAHRILETFYADRTGYRSEEWHSLADAREHDLAESDLEALSSSLGYPAYDPHGDPIPDRLNDLPALEYSPITALLSAGPLQVVHIEDEPPEAYLQIVEAGIYPGSKIQPRKRSADQLSLRVNGAEVTLPIEVARSIHAVPCQPQPGTQGIQPLSSLDTGVTGIVTEFAPGLRGTERGRLMDLGIIPGTHITPELDSPAGDPRAYRVREALIALRRDQAENIRVRPEGMEANG